MPVCESTEGRLMGVRAEQGPTWPSRSGPGAGSQASCCHSDPGWFAAVRFVNDKATHVRSVRSAAARRIVCVTCLCVARAGLTIYIPQASASWCSCLCPFLTCVLNTMQAVRPLGTGWLAMEFPFSRSSTLLMLLLLYNPP